MSLWVWGYKSPQRVPELTFQVPSRTQSPRGDASPPQDWQGVMPPGERVCPGPRCWSRFQAQLEKGSRLTSGLKRPAQASFPCASGRGSWTQAAGQHCGRRVELGPASPQKAAVSPQREEPARCADTGRLVSVAWSLRSAAPPEVCRFACVPAQPWWHEPSWCPKRGQVPGWHVCDQIWGGGRLTEAHVLPHEDKTGLPALVQNRDP